MEDGEETDTFRARPFGKRWSLRLHSFLLVVPSSSTRSGSPIEGTEI